MTVALRRGLRASLLAAVLTLTALCSSASAYTFGTPDATFGSGGVATFVPPGSTGAQVNAIAVQPDGKLIAAGIGDGSNRGWVGRFSANGAPDPTFGTNGFFAFAQVGITNPAPQGIAIQPDGKIVVAGGATISGDWQLVFRLNSDGTLDTNADSTPASCFGSGCFGYIVSVAATGDSNLSDVEVLPNGDILVAGDYVDTGAHKLLVHRFTSDGTPDSAFNSAATTATSGVHLASGDPTRVRILLHPDGNYVLASAIDSGKFAAVELNTSGGIVSGYGAAGVAAVGTNISFGDAVLRPDGSVVFAGAADTPDPQYSVAIGGVDATGETDIGFGAGGVAVTNITPHDRNGAMGIRRLSDGRFIVLGLSFTPGTVPYATTSVFSSGGQLDPSYGNAGVMRHVELGTYNYPTVLELAAKDKALLGGVVADLAASTERAFIEKLHGTNDPDPIVPSSKVTSPSKSRYKAKKLTKFRGKATPPGKIAKVEIALQRVDSKLLKKKRQCLWLSSSKAKFKKSKAVAKKCSKQRWLKASGTDSWSYKFKKKLPKGKYVLSVRAIATDGNVQTAPTTKRFQIT